MRVLSLLHVLAVAIGLAAFGLPAAVPAALAATCGAGGDTWCVQQPTVLNGGATVVGRTTFPAPAGMVGEFVKVTPFQISVTNNTITDLASAALTAGDWDCRAAVTTSNTANAMSGYQAWLNTVSVTSPSNSTAFVQTALATGDYTGIVLFSVGVEHFALSAATTVYLSIHITAGSGSNTSGGTLECRRED
jgi:hypothetical protein